MPGTSVYPGIRCGVTAHGATVLRLHYAADPTKDEAWAEAERSKMTDPSLYRQEYEIDGSATLGQLIYQLHDEATLEPSFPIPPDWTRYFALDPHPAVPHACLWGAVDRWGDLWIYRELWPSKVYGKPGNVPEDDNRYRIKEYAQTLAYLEGEENNQYQEQKFRERLAKRVIDYAARAFGKGTADDPEQPNYQQRYEAKGMEVAEEQHIDFALRFEDSKKDHSVGEETVNEWLKPRDVDDGRDGFKRKSRMHIFSDRCPELIYELKNVRRKQLSAQQAEMQDPSGEQVAKRNHMTDCLRYLCMANPVYLDSTPERSTWQPSHDGIAY